MSDMSDRSSQHPAHPLLKKRLHSATQHNIDRRSKRALEAQDGKSRVGLRCGVDFVTDGFGRDASDQLVAVPVRPSEERLACDIGERPIESTVHLRRIGLHVNDEHDGLLTPYLLDERLTTS